MLEALDEGSCLLIPRTPNSRRELSSARGRSDKGRLKPYKETGPNDWEVLDIGDWPDVTIKVHPLP